MVHTLKEHTLVILKPDAFQRAILGQIITRFENKGIKILGIKMTHLNDEILSEHYAHHKDKAFFDELKNFMSSAPVVALALEGLDVVKVVRTLIGSTSGRDSAPGTIRGDFSISRSVNIIHASDSVENGQQEVRRFFKENELFHYDKAAKEFYYDPGELA